MNLLRGHAAIQHLSTDGIDPYEGLDASAIDIVRIAKLLGVTQRCVRAGIVSDQRDCSPLLRHCPRCIFMGYHGRAHQMLHHDRCTAHGLPLIAAEPARELASVSGRSPCRSPLHSL